MSARRVAREWVSSFGRIVIAAVKRCQRSNDQTNVAACGVPADFVSIA